MKKYSFMDDYSEGCHPNVLELMSKSNLVQQSAYGEDDYSQRAKSLIRDHLTNKNTPIYFIAGGTLTNIIIISSILKSHEAVISANSGHIVCRETGAIEATGHKIITAPSTDGKLTPEVLESTLAENSHYPHVPKSRLVYISNSTEVGTVYTKAELKALSSACKANNLLLFLDGARLGAALTADLNDLTLNDIAEFTDIFWIGGTKAGALLGEAIVIPNQQLAEDFSFHIKQRGALLAKGRLLGIQFAELFENDLFFELCQHSNTMAKKLSSAIGEEGHHFFAKTESNQIFPILPNSLIETLQASFDFYVWNKADDNNSVVRLVTSWATDEDQVDEFINLLSEWHH